MSTDIISIDVEEFLEIKETLNKKQRERDKLIGTKEALMDQLKKLGYKTVEAAQKGLDKMEEGIKKKEALLAEDISNFTEQYGELI